MTGTGLGYISAKIKSIIELTDWPAAGQISQTTLKGLIKISHVWVRKSLQQGVYCSDLQFPLITYLIEQKGCSQNIAIYSCAKSLLLLSIINIILIQDT